MQLQRTKKLNDIDKTILDKLDEGKIEIVLLYQDDCSVGASYARMKLQENNVARDIIDRSDAIEGYQKSIHSHVEQMSQVEKATKFSHTFRLIERLQTRIATLKLLRKQELYKADHNKSDQDKLNENMLDVVVVTAVSIELQAVRKVLVKAGCTSFPNFQIRDSSDEVLMGGVATKLQLQKSTFNVGVFCLLQMGHEGATDFLQAIKYGVESKQVSESGLLVMIGMCAGNPDSKVKFGTIMAPQSIANETGVGSKLDAKTCKFETSVADAKVSHRVCTAVQAASPEFCGYDWLDKYLPDEVKNTPSPLFLQDAILAALNVHPNEMNVAEVHRKLFSAYENWPENIITKEVVKEALGILKREYVTEDDKKFSINEKGRKCIKDIESDSDFPRSDSQDLKVNKNPMISGAFVRVGMTDKQWKELKDQAAKRKASGFDMEGYGYLSYAGKHLSMLTTWFVKVVTNFATKESKMDYYQDYGACLAAAFFLHVLEKTPYLAGVAARK